MMTPLSSSRVTPLVLTYNEEPNIRRTLDALEWAARVVVLDSGSTDETQRIVQSYPNAVLYQRKFDRHGAQWDYGIRQTDMTSDYVLALDADMIVPPEFVAEMEEAFLTKNYAGGITPFSFSVYGDYLYGSIYPAQLRLFKPAVVCVTQSGHTQEIDLSEESRERDLYRFSSKLIHDDRKPLDRWVQSQVAYSQLEYARIKAISTGGSKKSHRLRDRLRHAGVMPLIAGALAYMRAGGPLRGVAAKHYAYHRATFEALLALRLLTDRLEKKADGLGDKDGDA